MALTADFQQLLLAGARLEMGKVNFSGSDTTVEVPTKMRTHIRCGFGVTEDQTAVSQDGVITAGAVTFTRPAGGTSGAGFNYILIGH